MAAEVIVNPASVSADRRGLWRAAGLVRAFENSVHVAAALGAGYRYADGRLGRVDKYDFVSVIRIFDKYVEGLGGWRSTATPS